jgi:hypothetical protein
MPESAHHPIVKIIGYMIVCILAVVFVLFATHEEIVGQILPLYALEIIQDPQRYLALVFVFRVIFLTLALYSIKKIFSNIKYLSI